MVPRETALIETQHCSFLDSLPNSEPKDWFFSSGGRADAGTFSTVRERENLGYQRARVDPSYSKKSNNDRQSEIFTTAGKQGSVVLRPPTGTDLSGDGILALKRRSAFFFLSLTLLSPHSLVPLLLLSRQCLLALLVGLIAHNAHRIIYPDKTGTSTE